MADGGIRNGPAGRRRSACALGVTAGLLAPPCLAAEALPAAPPPAAPATAVGEIVVTATRQAQSITKIPETVTALTSKMLQVRGLDSMGDIVRVTPGVELNPNGFGTQADINIRGISSFVGMATTGVYINDTPIQTRVVGYSSTNTYPLVFDLERVEVLFGPQGTLFGAGSEGGTVRFITPAPGLERYSVYAKGDLSGTRYSGTASYDGGVAVGGPIVRDWVGFRASFWAQHQSGWVDRVNANPEIAHPTVYNDVNSQDAEVASLAVGIQAAPNLTITPSVFWQNRWLNDIGTFWEDLSDPAAGRFISGQPLGQPDHDEFVLPALNIVWHVGGLTITSNTSMFQRNDKARLDYSTLVPAIFAGVNFIPGSPGYASYAQMINKQTVYAEELRAQSAPSDRLNWVAGLFLSQSKQKSYEAIVDPNFGDVTEYAYGLTVEEALGLPLINNTYSLIAGGFGEDKQAAVFGEANYQIIKQLKLTAGLRVAAASFTGASAGTGPFVGDTIVQPRSTINETPVTPRFSLTWTPDDRDLLYFTAAKGYRIGGTNAPLSTFCDIAAQGYSSVPVDYASDSVWSYEVGAKSQRFNGRLQAQVSAFHINWSNIQQLVYVSNCGQQFVDNLGAATSNGVSLQLTAAPVSGLVIDATVAYTHATYTQTVNKNPGNAANVVTAGDHLDTQPWGLTIGATYSHHLFARTTGYLRLDYEYHSGSDITPILDPANGGYDPSALPTPQTTYAALRAGAQFDGIDLSLFVDNVFSATPLITRYSEVLGNPVHRDFTLRPLTIGVTAAYRY